MRKGREHDWWPWWKWLLVFRLGIGHLVLYGAVLVALGLVAWQLRVAQDELVASQYNACQRANDVRRDLNVEVRALASALAHTRRVELRTLSVLWRPPPRSDLILLREALRLAIRRDQAVVQEPVAIISCKRAVPKR